MAHFELSPSTKDAISAGAHEALVDAEEFGKAFFHSAVENPINGIGQLVSAGHLPQLHIFEPDPHATGAAKWAQIAGSAAGTLVDCVLLSELSAVAVAGVVGEAAVAGTAAEAAVAGTAGLGLGGRLAATGMAGFASGALLTPLAPGESQWHRLSNGVTQAASFMTFDGVSSGIASQIASPTLLNTVLRSGAAGGFAGLVNSEVKSVTEGHGLAKSQDVISGVTSWATGAAVMGGASYLLAKGWEALGTKSESSGAGPQGPELTTRSARLADGSEAKVSLESGADGAARVRQVELADGTVLTRQGEGNRWSSAQAAEGATGQPHTEWSGDVKVNDQGQVRFVYQYEKAASSVTVEARLPDGSKVALANSDGSISLPGGHVDAVSGRLPDTAVQSVKALGVDIGADRLKLEGVTTNGGVSTNYVVDLSAEEAAKVRVLATQNAGIKIVPADQVIASPTTASVAGAGAASGAHIAENAPGAYEYDRPMPDHTSTMAVFTPGEDGSWKVLGGLRGHEPYAGRSALPGGFLDMSGGAIETPAQAASRELAEETGIVANNPKLLGVADAIGRDSRNRIIDFQFGTVASKEDMARLFAGDDLKDLQLYDVNQLLKNPDLLAFDHHDLLVKAYNALIKPQAPAVP